LPPRDVNEGEARPNRKSCQLSFMIVFLLLMLLTATVAAVAIARRNDAATHEEIATLLWSRTKAALAEAHDETTHEEMATTVGIQGS